MEEALKMVLLGSNMPQQIYMENHSSGPISMKTF